MFLVDQVKKNQRPPRPLHTKNSGGRRNPLHTIVKTREALGQSLDLRTGAGQYDQVPYPISKKKNTDRGESPVGAPSHRPATLPLQSGYASL